MDAVYAVIAEAALAAAEKEAEKAGEDEKALEKATEKRVAAKQGREEKDLFALVKEGDLRTAVERLQNGADVDDKFFSDVTPLHHAVKFDKIDMVAALLNFSADPMQTTPSGISMADLAKSETTKTLLGFFSGEVEIDATNTKLVVSALDKFVRWRLVKQLDALKEKHKKQRQGKPKSKASATRLGKLAVLEQKRSIPHAPGPETGMVQQSVSEVSNPPRKEPPEKRLSPAKKEEATSAATLPPTPKQASREVVVAPSLEQPDVMSRHEAESVEHLAIAEPELHTGSLREQLAQKERQLSNRYAAFKIQKPPSLKEKPAAAHSVFAASTESVRTARVEEIGSAWRPPSPPRSLPYHPFGPPPRGEQQASIEGQSSASNSRAAPAMSRAPRPRSAQEEALTMAVQEGDLLEVIRLLLSGADPEAPDFAGETPLFEAAVSGDVNITAALLLLGADAEQQSLSGATASSFSDNSTVSTLLELFASMSAQVFRNYSIRASDREAALQQLLPAIRWSVSLYLQGKGWASRQSLEDFVAAAGAADSSPAEEAWSPLEQAEDEAPALPALQDVDPLIRAVRQGALADVEQMLIEGATPDVLDELGETPLFEAIASANTEIVVALMLARADPDYKSTAGQKPVDLAIDKDVRSALDIFTAEDVTPEMWNFASTIKNEDLRKTYLEMLNVRQAARRASVYTRAFTGQH